MDTVKYPECCYTLCEHCYMQATALLQVATLVTGSYPSHLAIQRRRLLHKVVPDNYRTYQGPSTVAPTVYCVPRLTVRARFGGVVGARRKPEGGGTGPTR